MLNIEKEMLDDTSMLLRMGGELNIETVAQFRDAMLEAFTAAERILVDCDHLDNIDFFGLQVLCSAHRTSVVKKKLLTWQGGRPEFIGAVMQGTGFSRHCGCNLCPSDIDCMWV